MGGWGVGLEHACRPARLLPRSLGRPVLLASLLLQASQLDICALLHPKHMQHPDLLERAKWEAAEVRRRQAKGWLANSMCMHAGICPLHQTLASSHVPNLHAPLAARRTMATRSAAARCRCWPRC